MRLDELARRAGVATTTVRLYQNKGLLPPPRLVGRVGYYDEHHLTRLELVGRLQEQGFSLAGIGRLLETWEEGRDLGALVSLERGGGTEQLERELAALLGGGSGSSIDGDGDGGAPAGDAEGQTHGPNEVVLDAAVLAQRFPADAITPAVIRRAASMGLLELMDDGRFRVPDRRFLETGSQLAALGVPTDVVLDEWLELLELTDTIADRFIDIFERHLLPSDWRDGTARQAAPDAEAVEQVMGTLRTLARVARQVLLAALDNSLARQGALRFDAFDGRDDRGST